MESKSKIQSLYERHSHLAEYYARKIFNEGNISLEREDIEQELRIKIWTSIQSYVKRWSEYKKTGRMKPMPLEFYLKTALINKSKDFIKEINKSVNIPLSSIEFDYGQDECPIEIDFLNKKIKIGHTDILEDLSIEEKKIIILYIKGFSMSKISKMYKGDLNTKDCIRENVDKIRKKVKESAFEITNYSYFSNED
jgi:RNA polymerase sigma factor (sigma-70 family)